MSIEDLIEYALTTGDVASKNDELKEQLSNMENRLAIAESNSSIAANSNKLLLGRIASLESRAVECERASGMNAQYLRRRQREVTDVPLNIEQADLKKSVSEVLSLTGEIITPDDIDVCHRLQID